MDLFGNATGQDQRLMVTFSAHRHDLRDIAEDLIAAVPLARLKYRNAKVALEDGVLHGLVDVGMALPDDATMLNNAMRVIFHAQGDLRSAIKVRRVYGDCAATVAAAA